MSSKIDRRLLDTNAAAMGGGVGLAVLESMFSLVQSQSVMNAAMVRDYQLSHPLAMESLAVALNEILDPCGARYDDYDDDGVVVPIRRMRRAAKPRRRPPDPDDTPPSGGGGAGLGGGLGGPAAPEAPGGPETPEPPDGFSDPSARQPKKAKRPMLKAPNPFADEEGEEDDAGPGGGDMAELAELLSEFVREMKKVQPGAGDGAEHTTTTTKTSEHIESSAQMEAFLNGFINMMSEHLGNLSDINKRAVSGQKLMVT